VRKLSRTVEIINALEPEYKALADAELGAKTAEFRQKLANGASLDDLLPHAYAAVREASVRLLGQRHYDTQLMGGIVLHQGRIAEMRTGEGKTLAATLPLYLNALSGKGAHLVTVNDYLAKRDSEWMGQIYKFMGLRVGLIVSGLEFADRQSSYAADITYGTNNEFGFDYLRDNMVVNKAHLVQREHHFAIVDEVDSILIDEARTPLIISGPVDKPTDMFYHMARIVSTMKEGKHYEVDEKARTVTPTDDANDMVERAFNVSLKDIEGMRINTYFTQALRAKALMKRDRDYIVQDGKILIVDEFTGRLMFGRRYSEGLHEAIEAKEGLKIEKQSQTLATITLQNYFRMYHKLAGMTGTAATEEEEFQKIYGMDVVVLPTNEEMRAKKEGRPPVVRKDFPDVVYKTEAAKFRAVAREIAERHESGQPLLVGTVSVEKSEALSDMLKNQGIRHQVLNAKYHEKEAEIVAQAGRFGTVTIATNMAGRGTDILLGGNPAFMALEQMKREGYEEDVRTAASEQLPTEDPLVLEARARFRQLRDEFGVECEAEHKQVVALGGLHIIGTERHESRRIDNQLRGRCGRQGDPGSTRFYVALEDDLMRLFGADNVAGIMDKIGLAEDEPIEHVILSRAIETAQKRVEARNFSMRKHVLEYDDIMNKQREVIYAERRKVLMGEDLRPSVDSMIERAVDSLVRMYAPDGVHHEEWDLAGMVSHAESALFGRRFLENEDISGHDRSVLKKRLLKAAQHAYDARKAEYGDEIWREIESVVLLRTVDDKWKDHLESMDHLREGIGLRAYGQRDPLLEYKMEAFNYFEQMVESIEHDTLKFLYQGQFKVVPQLDSAPSARSAQMSGGATPKAQKKKVGRNAPCPCGSGKKYKHCCGKHA